MNTNEWNKWTDEWKLINQWKWMNKGENKGKDINLGINEAVILK